MKTPPVEGTRATSPKEVEKVERSSWANCLGMMIRLGMVLKGRICVWGLRVFGGG